MCWGLCVLGGGRLRSAEPLGREKGRGALPTPSLILPEHLASSNTGQTFAHSYTPEGIQHVAMGTAAPSGGTFCPGMR